MKHSGSLAGGSDTVTAGADRPVVRAWEGLREGDHDQVPFPDDVPDEAHVRACAAFPRSRGVREARGRRWLPEI